MSHEINKGSGTEKVNWYRSAFSTPQESSKWGLVSALGGIATALAVSKLIPSLNDVAVALISAAVFFSIRLRLSLSKYPMFWVATAMILVLNSLLVYEISFVPSLPKAAFFPIALLDVAINTLIYLGAQFVTGTEDA